MASEPGSGASSSASRRKDDHLRLAAAQHEQAPARNDFDDVELVHHALAAIDRDRVDLGVTFGPLSWPLPFYINGMTGGTETTARVNRELAIAARECNVPMASGSVGIALDDEATRPGFEVIRAENPDGFVMANIGAGRGADDARRAVALLAADALQVHLNAVQETVMPEGSREFSTWLATLEAVVAAVDVPVIVKEVGFGLSRRTLRELAGIGVRIADVAGSGGTDFARIENDRRNAGEYAYLAGHGQSTVCCLLDAPADGPDLLGSGGVRTPLDVVRALALGARAVGVAGRFLRIALDGDAPALVDAFRGWTDQVAALLALVGAPSPADARQVDLLVRGNVREFCQLRSIDAAALSRRSERTDGR